MPGQTAGTSPAAEGYRWPAEWETHRATWLAWPHNEETWPGALGEAETAFAEIALALCDAEQLEILVPDERIAERADARLRRAGVPPAAVQLHTVPTDDSWIRDTGPIFLTGPDGLAAADFRFDAWGGKYPPWERDAAVAAAVAARTGARVFPAPFVLEGGAIDGDGRGTLLSTESCLLESRPEPGRDRAAMEERLAHYLGADRVIWLTGEVVGDDTDGHIDDLARFVAPGSVVAGREDDPSDPNRAPLEENYARLVRARDASGRPLEVTALPMPRPVASGGGPLPGELPQFLCREPAGARSDLRRSGRFPRPGRSRRALRQPGDRADSVADPRHGFWSRPLPDPTGTTPFRLRWLQSMMRCRLGLGTPPLRQDPEKPRFSAERLFLRRQLS